MGWRRKNIDFSLKIYIPDGHSAKQDFRYMWYRPQKIELPDNSLLLAYEGPYRPLLYLATVARQSFKLSEVYLEYQGEFSRNPTMAPNRRYLVNQQSCS